MTAPDDGRMVRPVDLIVGLSNEKNAESIGDDCALDTIRLSLPSTEDESLHRTAEADDQIEASLTDDPTLVEEEYPSDAKVLLLPINVTLMEPELGAFLPTLERT